MTPAIVDEIWENSNTKGSPRLLLLAIARHADHDGTNAWPSLARLKRMTRLSHSTVCALLNALVAGGHLHIVHGGSPDGTNLYTVLRPWAQTSSPKIGHAVLGYPKIGHPPRRPRIGHNPEPKEKTGCIATSDIQRSDVQRSDPLLTHDDPDLQRGRTRFASPNGPAEQAIQALTTSKPPLRLVSTKKRTKVAPPPDADFDPTIWYLGDMCPGKHEYRQTGMTLKKRKGNKCPQCQAAWLRDYRQKQSQAQK